MEKNRQKCLDKTPVLHSALAVTYNTKVK